MNFVTNGLDIFNEWIQKAVFKFRATEYIGLYLFSIVETLAVFVVLAIMTMLGFFVGGKDFVVSFVVIGLGVIYLALIIAIATINIFVLFNKTKSIYLDEKAEGTLSLVSKSFRKMPGMLVFYLGSIVFSFISMIVMSLLGMLGTIGFILYIIFIIMLSLVLTPIAILYFYYYMIEDKGIVESIKYAFNNVKTEPTKYIGTYLVFTMLILAILFGLLIVFLGVMYLSGTSDVLNSLFFIIFLILISIAGLFVFFAFMPFPFYIILHLVGYKKPEIKTEGNQILN